VSPAARRRSRGGGRRPGNDREFWGEPDADREFEPIRPTETPAAMITSLGPAPLPGRETIAEHYYVAIYERAAALAGALAAASDLLADDTEDDEDGDRGDHGES
jgi:hypothetical protein